MIVYHVQYPYTCTRAHPQRTSSQGKARVGQKYMEFVSKLNGPSVPWQADCRVRQTRRLPREDPPAEVGEVVGVGVRVGPVEFKLYTPR